MPGWSLTIEITCSHTRKNPWRLSSPRKNRVRQRLQAVDDVIATVEASGVQTRALTEALKLPKEHEMPPRDKYTTFSKTSRGFRKSVHKVRATADVLAGCCELVRAPASVHDEGGLASQLFGR